MVEELKVKLTADVDSFKKGMKDARDSLEETTDQGEEAQSSFQRMARTMESISPSFKAAADKWRESSEKIGSTFSKNSKMAKGFKLAGLAAIGGVVAAVLTEVTKAIVEAAKKVWEFAKDTAKMYDPQGYSKSAGAVEKSMRKLKTAIGSFTAPIVNVLNSVFSKIIDGVTWIIEKVRIGIAYVTGIVKAVFEPVVNGIRQVVTWVQGAINVLGNFLGMGDIFKKASDSASDTADSMEEVVEATSAGLASFDKLTTLNFEGMGDAEEADKISDAIGEAEKDGKDLIEGLNKWLEKLDLKKVWDDFVQGCIDIKDKIVEAATGWFDGAKEWASDVWGKFVKGCGDVKTKIVTKVKDWFSDASSWASGMWSKFVTWAGDVKTKVVTKVKDWFSDASSWASGMWSKFVTWAGDVKDDVVKKILTWFSDASSWAYGVWSKFVNWAGDVKNDVVTKIKTWFTDASSWASGVWSKFVTWAGDVKADVVTKVTGWFSDASSWASSMWGKFTTWAGDVKADVVTKVTDWFSGASEWASGVWSKFVTWAGDKKSEIVEKVTDWFSDAGSWASSVWTKFVNACGEAKTYIVTKIQTWFEDASEWASGVWEEFKTKCKDVWTTLKDDIITPIWNKISEPILSFWEKFKQFGIDAYNVLCGLWEAFYNNVIKPILDTINKILDLVKNAANTVRKVIPGGSGGSSSKPSGSSGGKLITTNIPQQAEAVSGITTNPIGTVAEVLTEGLKDVAVKGDTLGEQLKSVSGQVTNPLGTVVKVIGGGLKKIFGLENGAAIGPNNPQPYILGDNKREYEVVSPVSLMEQTVMSAMRKMGMGTSGQSDRPIEVSIELDGRKMARALYDPMETEKRRRGVRT